MRDYETVCFLHDALPRWAGQFGPRITSALRGGRIHPWGSSASAQYCAFTKAVEHRGDQ